MPEATFPCAAPVRFVEYFTPAPAPYAPLFHHPWTIHSMAMGEMTTPRSPLQSDSEGSTSSLELGSGVASLALNGTPPPAVQEAVKCRWQHCGLWFQHLDQLAMHVTMVHAAAGQGGLFYCGWDGCSRGHRGFNARYKMLVHVRTHTNEKPHRCTQCDKSFSRAENLKIHARSHTGERPYTCPVPGCSKAYSNSSDRFKHTRTHAVDKPYVCKVEGCPKRYTDPSSLRKHVKTYRHFPGSVLSPLDSPHGSPHGSPLRSPSSDEESRSAFRTVVSTSSESLSPASLERPPLPGDYRGFPIKKAISARMRGALRRDPDSVSDYEHATDGSLSPPLATPLTAASSGLALNHQRSWAGGSVWVSAAALGGTASPDTLSPSSSPSGVDWFPHGSMPVPVVPWGLSLWGFPSREEVHPHPHFNSHPMKLEDQAVPLDLTVTRH